MQTIPRVDIKTVGVNGQISLGKQYAGCQVLIEMQEQGVWLVRTATVIPDNERWLHQEPVQSQLREAMEWAQNNPASDAGTAEIMEHLRND